MKRDFEDVDGREEEEREEARIAEAGCGDAGGVRDGAKTVECGRWGGRGAECAGEFRDKAVKGVGGDVV